MRCRAACLLLVLGLTAPAPARARARKPLQVHTIGYASHSQERFLELLRRSKIQLVVDVRSRPTSRRMPHFHWEGLQVWLPRARVGYLRMGHGLGGFPADRRLYKANGKANYDLMARRKPFRAALSNLIKIARGKRVAVMCTEEDPARCHRNLLVGRELARRGVQVMHIRADGRVQRAAWPRGGVPGAR